MSRKVIAFDFDGTITQGDNYETDAPPAPNEAMIRKIREEHGAYNFIVIFTARPAADRNFIERVLQEWEVPYDVLKTDKLRYDVFYDDRTISPKDSRWPK
jgi:hypothetical protein